MTSNDEIKEAMKQELALWWATRVAATHTFQPPLFQIGLHSAAQTRVFMNGAISTEGAVRLFTLDTQGWTGVGDAVTVPVEVKRKGLYQVSIQSSEVPAGMRVRLQIGDTFVDGEVGRLPAIELDFGKKDLTFTVMSAPNGTFLKLESLDFTLIHELQRYPSCEDYTGGYGAPFSCASLQCRKVNSE